MWQKARIIQADKCAKSLLGRTVWVKGRPITTSSISQWNGGVVEPHSAFVTNVDLKPYAVIHSAAVELLGGPDAFAEDVPLISWDEFIRGES